MSARTDTPRRLDTARRLADSGGWIYAEESLQAAVGLLREKLPTAGLVVVNHEVEDGSPVITLLAVYTREQQMLWFRDLYAGHPDARELGADRNPGLDVDSDEFSAVEDHLRTAYVQAGPNVFYAPTNSRPYEGLMPRGRWDLRVAEPTIAVPEPDLDAVDQALLRVEAAMYRSFILSKVPQQDMDGTDG
jgi:hypothetical protein